LVSGKQEIIIDHSLYRLHLLSPKLLVFHDKTSECYWLTEN